MGANRDIELTERQRYWLAHIRRGREQRMSMAAYAREHGLNGTALYYWKKRLLELGVLSERVSAADFAAVRIQAGDGVCCRIRFPNGAVVELGASMGGMELRQLLAAVHQLS